MIRRLKIGEQRINAEHITTVYVWPLDNDDVNAHKGDVDIRFSSNEEEIELTGDEATAFLWWWDRVSFDDGFTGCVHVVELWRAATREPDVIVSDVPDAFDEPMEEFSDWDDGMGDQ